MTLATARSGAWSILASSASPRPAGGPRRPGQPGTTWPATTKHPTDSGSAQLSCSPSAARLIRNRSTIARQRITRRSTDQRMDFGDTGVNAGQRILDANGQQLFAEG